MTKKEKKSFNQSLAEWKLFLYNPTTGEFLGRTAKSWGLILLFYLVFYGFLAALFSFTMWVMLQTLNDEIPKYRDQIPSPGLMVFPKPVTALEYTFSATDPASYEEYIKELKKFLNPYGLEEQKNLTACTDGVLFEQKGPVYVACQFPISLLEECSGGNDPDFGYSRGNPCILVKMNRVLFYLKCYTEITFKVVGKNCNSFYCKRISYLGRNFCSVVLKHDHASQSLGLVESHSHSLWLSQSGVGPTICISNVSR
uniref:Sodium/potassium-transporting ATPase subunit beta n=1 Tax=Prolemur simus TaxID=1328070 RepID=A0A8C9A8X5_PROSS